MKYKIEFKRSAYKEYEKLPRAIKTRIDDALEILCVNPFSEILSFKKLRGVENSYRIRVGDYRILYRIIENEKKVLVVMIKHRRDIYAFGLRDENE